MATLLDSPRILLVEDSEPDAQLIWRELYKADLLCVHHRVDSAEGLRAALREFKPDIVLSDHALPAFSAHDALRLVRAEYPDIPVIIVTGSLDEESAAQYIIDGAVDYVVKARLFRLGAAVRRALELKQAQADARRADAALRELEDQHRQVQKMDAIGRVASSVAHDFNNLLTVIGSYCDLALEDVPVDATIRPNLLQIREAVAQAARLTTQLLAFSRRRPPTLKVVDLNTLVDTMTAMLRRLLGELVEVVFVPAPGLSPALVDPGGLEQVVMNLAVNARDAMPRGGVLTLATQDVEVDLALAAARDVRPGPYARLSVTDTGGGIAAETRSRLFEPFFTTKGPGKGTGLGLATVYAIVQRAGGFIQVDSELGKGSTFSVYLPRFASRPGADPGV
jgi:signal transduction histidine kinase